LPASVNFTGWISCPFKAAFPALKIPLSSLHIRRLPDIIQIWEKSPDRAFIAAQQGKKAADPADQPALQSKTLVMFDD